MVRLLHGADFHLGLTRHSQPGTTSRADDFAATVGRFVDTAIEQRVDLAVLAGDSFHTRKPFPRDLFALTKAAARCQKAGVTLLISEGNHDGKDNVGDPRSAALGFLTPFQPNGVFIITRQVAEPIRTLSGKSLNLVSTPYPHKNSFDAVMPEASLEERIEAIGVKLEEGIAAFIGKVEHDTPELPTLFLGHLSVLGAKIGTEVSMRFGWDVAVRSGVFDGIEYAALGHIHRQQQIGERAWYAGSPEYMDFGEEGQTKGFLLVEMEKGKSPKVEVLPSGARPMVTLSASWTADDQRWTLDGTVPDGAIVRIQAHVARETTPEDMVLLSKQLRASGASYFKVEPVVPEDVRSVDRALDSKVDEGEALRAWLVENKHPVEPALTVGLELMRTLAQSEDMGEVNA